MHPSRDLDLDQPPPANGQALTEDLALDTLLDAMAHGDGYLREVAERTLLTTLQEPEVIRYRQRILADCLEHPEPVRTLYELAVSGERTRRDSRFFWFRDSPDSTLQKSIGMLSRLTSVLHDVRRLADDQSESFRSDGFTRLFATLQDQLDDAYLRTIAEHLRALQFRRGALISASLGRGNRGTDYVLRKPHDRGRLARLTRTGPTSHSFTIAERDEHGMETLSELRGRGIARAAAALAQSTDHVLSFFDQLRAELAFYVGCLNLHHDLQERGVTTCFPDPLPIDDLRTSTRDLRDAALAFHLDAPVVGNDLETTGEPLIMVTGANQGGKSTFLRSVGLAQLMMQSGTFVAAEAFRAPVRRGVFTHFKREEDPTMTRGKLEEELDRMSQIAAEITTRSLLLCNESFSSTNEREGSEIARQVIQALIEAGISIVFVTHLYELADRLREEPVGAVLFLRAERMLDGSRTFRVVPGEPLPTSHGADSYRRIFEVSDDDSSDDASATGQRSASSTRFQNPRSLPREVRNDI